MAIIPRTKVPSAANPRGRDGAEENDEGAAAAPEAPSALKANAANAMRMLDRDSIVFYWAGEDWS